MKVNGVTYRVSYNGGDGNDVELTVVAVDENKTVSASEPESSEDAIIGRVYVIMGVLTLIIAIIVIVRIAKPSKS